MKTLGLRDIIGPVMVGPSSSHTAGALAIAKMARNLCAQPPARVTFTLYGSFAHTGSGHGTDKALVAGMLGFDACDLEIRDSFSIARDRGLDVEFVRETRRDAEHPNTVDIVMEEPDATRLEVRGVSVGGGAAVITRIDDIDVDVTGEHTSVVIRQRDERGVLAHIASCIAERGVNIATTRMYRTRRGATAYTVMETDDAIPPQVRSLIAEHESILDVRVIPAMNRIAASAPALDEASAEERFDAFDFTSGAELIALCAAGEVLYRARLPHARRGAVRPRWTRRGNRRIPRTGFSPSWRRRRPSPPTRPCARQADSSAARRRPCAMRPATTARLRCSTRSPPMPSHSHSPCLRPTPPWDASSPRRPQDRRAWYPPCSSRWRNTATSHATRYGKVCSPQQPSDTSSHATPACPAREGGGCQAEVGSAAGMAAAAAVAMTGGTASQALDAASNALTCLMGLVCDPVGGLVEIPCQKRNATAALTALASAQIALAGGCEPRRLRRNRRRHGRGRADASLRAAGKRLRGGIAATPSACAWCAGRG